MMGQIVVLTIFLGGRIDENDKLVFDGDILTWGDIVTALEM